MNLGFIGYGNMASAIAKGLVEHNVVKPDTIYAYAKHYDKLEKNCALLHINACDDIHDLIHNSDLIVLAVKPYQMKDVLTPVKDQFDGKIVVSIAAGMLFDAYEDIFDAGVHHISTLPNTPMATGKGIMVCENKHSLNEEELNVFTSIFSCIALLEFVDTNHFCIAGTLAGCTPAFTAMYIEALGDAGVKYGLPRDASYRLAAKMIEGVGALYLENQEHPGIMKDKVCSPAGTTIQGVSSLEKNGFRGIIIDAIDAIEGK